MSESTIHNRFNRKVWAFKKDFTGSLAKWLVKQSPYVCPKGLEMCIEKFDTAIEACFAFDTAGMCQTELNSLTPVLYGLLEDIPEVMALNVPKSERRGIEDPDTDFIDIMAVAQNITCEFADREDAQAYLDSAKTG